MAMRSYENVIPTNAIEPRFEFKWLVNKFGQKRLTETIVLKTAEKEIVLVGRPQTAFFRLIGTTRMHIIDKAYAVGKYTTRTGKVSTKRLHTTPNDANTEMRKFWEKTTVTGWKFLWEDEQVTRVTSEIYEGIPHELLQKIIRNRLDAESVEYDEKILNGGQTGVYSFMTGETQKVGNTIKNAVVYQNTNDGEHSFRLFGGGLVLVCSNGMVSMNTKSKMRLVHKLPEAEITRIVETELGRILESIDILPKQFLSLKEYVITKEQASQMISKLPVAKYVQMAVAQKLFGIGFTEDWDGTMWGLYMASTWVGTHMEHLPDRKKVREMRADVKISLQAVETYSEMWDKRESLKADESSKKLEVMSRSGSNP